MTNDSIRIALVAGTNRTGSQTLRVTKIYQKLFEAAGATVELVDLMKLPSDIFTPDAYASKPIAFGPFNEAILYSDGVMIVTPEYNGSFPGVLKMFIDMLKFPEAFEKRPVAFTGVAAGKWGAIRSVEQLQMILGYRNAFAFPERVFLPHVESQVAADGTFTDPLIRELVDKQVKGFVDFVRKLKKTRG